MFTFGLFWLIYKSLYPIVFYFYSICFISIWVFLLIYKHVFFFLFCTLFCLTCSHLTCFFFFADLHCCSNPLVYEAQTRDPSNVFVISANMPFEYHNQFELESAPWWQHTWRAHCQKFVQLETECKHLCKSSRSCICAVCLMLMSLHLNGCSGVHAWRLRRAPPPTTSCRILTSSFESSAATKWSNSMTTQLSCRIWWSVSRWFDALQCLLWCCQLPACILQPIMNILDLH